MSYGTSLKLPCDIFSEPDIQEDSIEIITKLRQVLRNLVPNQSKTNIRSTWMSSALKNCTHVFIRDDAHRVPLSPIYQGPYKVLDRYDRCYLLQLDARENTVHIDRLKPAVFMTDIGNESINDANSCVHSDVTFNIETEPFDHQFDGVDQTVANSISPFSPAVTLNVEPSDLFDHQFDDVDQIVAISTIPPASSRLVHQPNHESIRLDEHIEPANETDSTVTHTPTQPTDRRGRLIRSPSRFIDCIKLS